MHFEIWWVFVFALAASGISSITKIITAIIERNKFVNPRALQELAEKVERMSQAVDATAIEVERIGESQRFLTRVLSEQKELPRLEKVN